MQKAASVFLSYAHDDKEQVEGLYQKLCGAGFRPWMDTRDILPGERWQSSIRRAILGSDFVLVCLSENSVDRRGWVQREIKQALDVWQGMLDSDIYLIPVRLRECDVPESLREFQWVDLFEAKGWDRLLEAIQVGGERRAIENAIPEPPLRADRSTQPRAHDVLTPAAETGAVPSVPEAGSRASSQLSERAYLWQFLVDHFGLDQLRNLAFELDIDHESLSYNTVGSCSRELIAYLERRDQLRRLLEEVVRRYPDDRLAQILSDWPS